MNRYVLHIVRSLSQHKIPFFINLGGLIIGMSAVILATIMITDEIRFDKFHQDISDIYRVNKWDKQPSGIKSQLAETPGLMAPTMQADFPEVSYATRVVPWFNEVLLTYEDNNITTELLNAPGQVLITPDLAQLLQNWLQNYAFHLPIQAWNYLIAGLTMSSIVMLTIISQSIYAVRTNPIHSLRNE